MRRAIAFGVRGLIGLLVVGATMEWSADGATNTWDGGGGAADVKWTTAANWDNNVAPMNDGTADIVFAGATSLNPDTDVAFVIHTVTFDVTAISFTNGGSQLMIGSGGTG